jgi:hypothetical protein
MGKTATEVPGRLCKAAAKIVYYPPDVWPLPLLVRTCHSYSEWTDFRNVTYLTLHLNLSTHSDFG